MTRTRLEAFSDGVLAVAITLLVLDLKVPAPTAHESLAHALGQMWPNYVAYVISFLTIGIIWINHHAMIARLREPDHTTLILNLLLLMSIVVLPFATSLFANYLRAGNDAKLAAVIYGGALLTMAVLFGTLNRHILVARPELLHTEIPLERRKQILSRGVLGLIPYLIATGGALLSPYITLVMSGAIAVFYALPLASGNERDDTEPTPVV